MPVHTIGLSVNDVRRLGAMLLGESGLERWLSWETGGRSRAALIQTCEGRQVLMHELVQVMISVRRATNGQQWPCAVKARLRATPPRPRQPSGSLRPEL